MKIKAIIFDWGRTLFDSELKKEYHESEDLLIYCKSKGYRLAAVSLVSTVANTTLEERKRHIEESKLRKYFDLALVTDKDKDALFDQAVQWFGLPSEQVLVIDDRTIRGIKYANQHGHPSIWVQKGKFADELPNEQTGQPTYTVETFQEIMQLI